MGSRFAKNAVLLFSLLVPIMILRSFGVEDYVSFTVSALIFSVIFSHDKFVDRSYWEGMLFPIFLIAWFFPIAIILETISKGSDVQIRPFVTIAVCPIVIFYLIRLGFGRKSRSN